MKKLLLTLLILLLLAVGLVAGAGVYFYFKFKPFFIDATTSATPSDKQDDLPKQDVGTVTDKNPLLDDSQEQALENIGIDPAKLPTAITPELEACFTAKLGVERVKEIKLGQEPTAIDFFKTQSCIK